MMPSNLAGKRVMVVEDEMLVSLFVEDILSEAGCVVIGPFARLKEALAAAKVEMFDVALLDVNLANEKVFPVAYALEERGIPFLLLTGYGDSALPKDRQDWEACPKPYLPTDLVIRIARKIGEAEIKP
jgi:DNA-binding response OmpR family regulator